MFREICLILLALALLFGPVFYFVTGTAHLSAERYKLSMSTPRG